MNRDHRGVPPETLQRILDRTDLVDLISSYLTLNKAGQNFKGLCPFHSEKSPSFSVNPARQFFYCFGCGVGGDAFTFLMKQEGLDFPEAVRELSQRAGVPLPERREGGVRSTSTLSRQRYFQIHEKVAAWYHHNLMASPQGRSARDYLAGRGITQASLKTFQVGFASDEWQGLSQWAEREGVRMEELVQAGLAVRKEQEQASRLTIYDRFRGRVMFPIGDARGQIVGFGGRALEKEAQAKYLNSPETEVFRKSRTLYGLHYARPSFGSLGRAYVVEGYLDVIAFHQHGILNAVAPLGTALSADHVNQLRRLVPMVYLLFDGDAAGMGAALRTLDLFINSGLDVRVVLFPSGEDPDSFIRSQGVSAFRELESKAPTLLDFAITSVLEKTRPDSIQDRVKRADEVLTILQKTANPIEKDAYLTVVSERLAIRPEMLRKRLSDLRISKNPPSSGAPRAAAEVSVQVIPKGKEEERDLMVLLLQGRLESAHLPQLEEHKFSVPLYQEIIRRMHRYLDPTGRPDLDALLRDLAGDPAYQSAVSQLCVWDLHTEDVLEHILGCLRTLERKWLQRTLAAKTLRLKAAEREGQAAEADALLAEIQTLTQKKALLNG